MLKFRYKNRVIKLHDIKDIEIIEHKQLSEMKILETYDFRNNNDIVDFKIEPETFISYDIIISYYVESERLTYYNKNDAINIYNTIKNYALAEQKLKKQF